MNADPVVRGEPFGDLVRICCPWCGEVHVHGRGEGHRIAHCLGGTRGRGYTIEEGAV